MLIIPYRCPSRAYLLPAAARSFPSCRQEGFRAHKRPVLIRTGRLHVYENAVHLSSTDAHKRYSCRWLGLGCPAAHGGTHLMLLPSGPDMVRGAPLRRTQTSSLRAEGRPCMTNGLGKEFSPAGADCGLQDTATFPPSTARFIIRPAKEKINPNLSSPLTPGGAS